MSLASYQLFCTAAELGSLSKAAEFLSITPSAASHAMNALERSLGVALLKRDRNGAVLTVNGEMLLPHFREIMACENRLREEVAQINGLEKGTVRVGTFNSVCTQWIPGIIRSFSQKYPDVQVRICQEGYQAIEQMLLEGTLDIGFVSLPTSDRFSTITLLHDRLLCITPLDFRPRNQSYVTAEDLRNENLIVARRGYDRGTDDFIKSNGLEPCLQHDISLDSSVIALVESGMGVSILPELVLKDIPGRYQIFPLKNNKYRTIAIATLKQRSESPATSKMIQEIQHYVELISRNN